MLQALGRSMCQVLNIPFDYCLAAITELQTHAIDKLRARDDFAKTGKDLILCWVYSKSSCSSRFAQPIFDQWSGFGPVILTENNFYENVIEPLLLLYLSLSVRFINLPIKVTCCFGQGNTGIFASPQIPNHYKHYAKGPKY